MPFDDCEPASKAAAPARSASRDWLRALSLTAAIDKQPARTLPRVIDELAQRYGDSPALLSDRETLSFRDLAERSRQYARWALDQGLGKGSAVALIMPNRPEYMAVWLGLTRVGVVVALINTHLRGPSLAHCLDVAGASHIIVDAALESPVIQVAADLKGAPSLWVHGAGNTQHPRIDQALAAYEGGPLSDAEQPAVTTADRALLIYTSGTTGLPKAANVSHHRMMMWSHWFCGMMDVQPSDRLYDCLPMHHSVGGVSAIGAVLVGGGSVVVAEKFSARRFWEDVSRWDCTLFQYIGELCRYLLAAAPRDAERGHRLRLACGNGLQEDVWRAFEARFALPRILEFYASTEGSFSLYNAEGRPGAIGRIPAFLAHRFPAQIVRFDVQTGAPVRGADGFCIPCARGEAGEAIGRISRSAAANRFEGYTDAADSEKKLLRDVFEAGDAWMRTGDLMRLDAQGFYYFVDRIGDTFRWKGENVATTEVAEALCAHPGVRSASVYGVAVAGADGRAGMAALEADEDIDLTGLAAWLTERLPDYAMPLFLRLASELAHTETFKLKKQALIDEGYDPAAIADPLFVFDRSRGAYVPLDAAVFARIRAGDMRL
jgi:fatty-acyl-CoA synthase